MKSYLVYLCSIIIAITGFIPDSSSETDTLIGMPLKYISGCELDLNNDNEVDIVLLVETTRGRELIALMNAPSGYNQ